jgi:hypothetical protein
MVSPVHSQYYGYTGSRVLFLYCRYYTSVVATGIQSPVHSQRCLSAALLLQNDLCSDGGGYYITPLYFLILRNNSLPDLGGRNYSAPLYFLILRDALNI